MSLNYCAVCDRRVQYLKTPLFNALFKCLIKEYNFSDEEFIECILYQLFVNALQKNKPFSLTTFPIDSVFKYFIHIVTKSYISVIF